MLSNVKNFKWGLVSVGTRKKAEIAEERGEERETTEESKNQSG